MINVWNYANARKVKITDTDDNVFTGTVICVTDAEENGQGEDDISIQVDRNTIVGILQSEIKD